jgi:hypothetical protein
MKFLIRQLSVTITIVVVVVTVTVARNVEYSTRLAVDSSRFDQKSFYGVGWMNYGVINGCKYCQARQQSDAGSFHANPGMLL